MIDFHRPELSDKPWMDELLRLSDYRGCEYSFSSLFCWSRAIPQCVGRADERLFIRLCGRFGCSYSWPAGRGDMAAAIALLEEDAGRNWVPLRLVGLTPDQVKELNTLFPGRFDTFPDRDSFDYRYSIDKLSDLTGKRLHGKRNHIHRFEENVPNWRFEAMTENDLQECLDMDLAWAGDEPTEQRAERKAIVTAAEHFKELGMEGGVLRDGDRLLGFTMGDRLNSDSYDVHFEKALGEVQGAYAMVNREFARMIRERHPEVRFLNREEDMGIEGLRKAKLSYYPDEMVEKYFAVEKEK